MTDFDRSYELPPNELLHFIFEAHNGDNIEDKINGLKTTARDMLTRTPEGILYIGRESPQMRDEVIPFFEDDISNGVDPRLAYLRATKASYLFSPLPSRPLGSIVSSISDPIVFYGEYADTSTSAQTDCVGRLFTSIKTPQLEQELIRQIEKNQRQRRPPDDPRESMDWYELKQLGAIAELMQEFPGRIRIFLESSPDSNSVTENVENVLKLTKIEHDILQSIAQGDLFVAAKLYLDEINILVSGNLLRETRMLQKCDNLSTQSGVCGVILPFGTLHVGMVDRMLKLYKYCPVVTDVTNMRRTRQHLIVENKITKPNYDPVKGKNEMYFVNGFIRDHIIVRLGADPETVKQIINQDVINDIIEYIQSHYSSVPSRRHRDYIREALTQLRIRL